VTPVEFRGDLWRQKTRVPGLSCGVVCVILRLAVLVELRLVTDEQTDGQMDTGPWLVPRMHSIARKKLNQLVKESVPMNPDLLTKHRLFKRYHTDKHVSQILPTRWRQKSTGINMEQNCVNVTLCMYI